MTLTEIGNRQSFRKHGLLEIGKGKNTKAFVQENF